MRRSPPSTDGYLLTVDIPADSAGETVTISFRPPAWRFEVAAFATAIIGLVVWVVLDAVRRRRVVNVSVG